MATRLNVGEIYKATSVKSGTGNRGPWMLTNVYDDRGKNELTLFINNTDCNLRDNQQFKLAEIKGVSLGVRKGKGPSEGKWFPSYTAEVVVTPIVSEFEDIEVDENDPWSDLTGDMPPFNPDVDLPL